MRFTAAVTLTIALLAAPGCGDDTGPAAAAGDAAHAPAGSLPVVGAADLRRLIDETAAQDRVLVLDFWATWCEPCKALFPPLKAGLEPLGDRVRKATVTLDTPGEYEQKAIAYLQANDAMHDAYLLDPDPDAQLAAVAAVGDEWKDLVVPAILVFDADGNLAGEFFGADAEPILAKVRELTAAPGQQGGGS